jgi:cardiolipin synthase A/B
MNSLLLHLRHPGQAGLAALGFFALVHLAALIAGGHAVASKRDSRAATAWLILILFVPLFGTLAYVWVGINRVKRRAREMRRPPESRTARAARQPEAVPPELKGLLAVTDNVNHVPLSAGNSVRMLVNGDEAYPKMLAAIAEASQSISLVSYIFDNDPVGREFAEALCVAAERGVEVRVLVDAVGARYSFPSIFRRLRARNLKAARFLDTWLPWRFHYSQLRNHRKCLIVDGRLAFTGGMNIRRAHLVTMPRPDTTQDLHFRMEGPAVGELQEVFAQDWEFATGERLEGERWFPPLEPIEGGACVRVVPDGPDADFEKLLWTLLGAIGEARHSVRIVTPYFLPDAVLTSALGLAALRGVKVEILLPDHNNVFLVQWASRAQLWQVLGKGCRVYASPRPFDHSKFFLIDDSWALVGSANWDARSLRLNFELNLEVVDGRFAAILAAEFAKRRGISREVTQAELDARPLWVLLRDGVARLFSPYL